ncbi:hypothetical protein LPB72_11165 [Hydrogenophaga crassostreae]|uniref:Outer membrane protein beta-barrel domain-containing protein n=1 Tax=Hydrogenophaga crassostreae TaxID=1763535 RepID=A0A162SZ65_9BURK|nr:hypothetical protein [Hydrogenophaga crassostreae]AOW13558.1 hypothetical protein LPB072_12545 [Hydrogenophaga crassostreae]OAD41851.1 hypothetical protein LPB72_11165 [Hydrogenophaga crassostreae]
MIKIRAVCMAAALLSGSAMAQGSDGLPGNPGVYGVVGTGGLGLGLNLPVTSHLGVRGELVQGSVSETYTNEDITYKGDLKLRGSGLFADIRPFQGTFRVVLGATLGGSSAALEAEQQGGTFTIDGQSFSADGSKLRATIKYPSTMPYVGVGWGHGQRGEPGWTFAFDLGVAIGEPKITLAGNDGLLSQPGAAARIAAEERKAQDDVSSAKVLPVLKFSVGYSF